MKKLFLFILSVVMIVPMFMTGVSAAATHTVVAGDSKSR